MFSNNFQCYFAHKRLKNHLKKLQLGVFFSAAPTAQNSQEINFRFVNFIIQSSLLRSLVLTLVVEQWTGCSWCLFYSSLSQCLAWSAFHSSTPTVVVINITHINQFMSMMADILTHNTDICAVTGLAFIKMLIMVFITCFFVGAQLGI